MSPADREWQAEKFAGFHEMRGGSLEEDFGVWARSKFFSPADRAAIRRVVEETAIASGAAVVTDPGLWFALGEVR
jgi:hypothetical protein